MPERLRPSTAWLLCWRSDTSDPALHTLSEPKRHVSTGGETAATRRTCEASETPARVGAPQGPGQDSRRISGPPPARPQPRIVLLDCLCCAPVGRHMLVHPQPRLSPGPGACPGCSCGATICRLTVACFTAANNNSSTPFAFLPGRRIPVVRIGTSTRTGRVPQGLPIPDTRRVLATHRHYYSRGSKRCRRLPDPGAGYLCPCAHATHAPVPWACWLARRQSVGGV